MDETIPQLLRLLNEYNINGTTVAYCCICFRSEKDRLMVTPVYIYKVLGALKLAIYSEKRNNINVCSFCEALAKRAFTIHQLINLAVLVNRLITRLSRGCKSSENPFENLPPSMCKELKLYDPHLEKIQKTTAITMTNILCVSSKVASNDIIVVDEDDDDEPPEKADEDTAMSAAIPNMNPQLTLLNTGYQPQEDVFILPEQTPQNGFVPILLAPFNIANTSDGMITLVSQTANQPPAIINIPPPIINNPLMNNIPAICSDPLSITNPSVTNNLPLNAKNLPSSTKKTTNAKKLPTNTKTMSSTKNSTSKIKNQPNILKKSANVSPTYDYGSTYAVDRIMVTKFNDKHPTKKKKMQDDKLEPVRVFAGEVTKKVNQDPNVYRICDQPNITGLNEPPNRHGLAGLNEPPNRLDLNEPPNRPGLAGESHKNTQTNTFYSNNWMEQDKSKLLSHKKETQSSNLKRVGDVVVGDWLGEQVVKTPAVKEGRIDWEDKIPMDVISFVDKESSNMLVPHNPTPMGCISQVTSLREPHNYKSIQVIDLCE